MVLQVIMCLFLIGVPNSLVNVCFRDQTSESCLAFIAERRRISMAEASILRGRALALYQNEEPSPFAVYDRNTVAVACLASAARLRPGPDSDCAACGDACAQESRPEVCELYCSGSQSQTTQRSFSQWTTQILKNTTTRKEPVFESTFQSQTEEHPLAHEIRLKPNQILITIIITILGLATGLMILLSLTMAAILIRLKLNINKNLRQKIDITRIIVGVTSHKCSIKKCLVVLIQLIVQYFYVQSVRFVM